MLGDSWSKGKKACVDHPFGSSRMRRRGSEWIPLETDFPWTRPCQRCFFCLEVCWETLKGLYLKGLLSKHRSIACPLPLALASDLPCGVCTCKWDLQLPSPVRLWTDFPRPRGWRVTTALGNPFPCGTALGNLFPCRKVCFAQKAPLDKPPLRLPECVTLSNLNRVSKRDIYEPKMPFWGTFVSWKSYAPEGESCL